MGDSVSGDGAGGFYGEDAVEGDDSAAGSLKDISVEI